jgi:hypothetical protein
VDRDHKELLMSILRELIGDDEATKGHKGYRSPCEPDEEFDVCCGDRESLWFQVLLKLQAILCLLRNRRFGLREIKREVKAIEENMNGGNGNGIAGAQSTGPIFVRTGQNNAINVKVQNVGDAPATALVRLINIGVDPPQVTASTVLTNIAPCTAQDGVVTAPAGDFEVVVCPSPVDATVRVFVSVHSGNAATSAFEYVIKASEMLPLVCPFCEPE